MNDFLTILGGFVVFIEFFILIFRFKKNKNSKIKQTQKIGNNSKGIQVGGDFSVEKNVLKNNSIF